MVGVGWGHVLGWVEEWQAWQAWVCWVKEWYAWAVLGGSVFSCGWLGLEGSGDSVAPPRAETDHLPRHCVQLLVRQAPLLTESQ